MADLFGVETRALNQAVKRNSSRFPSDFMFRLSLDEWNYMSSQFVMTYNSKRPKTALPHVFSEHGVTMLASILKSEKAVNMSIQIVRAFIAMRTYLIELATTSKEISDLKERVKALESENIGNLEAINSLSEDTQKSIDDIYVALTELATKHNSTNKPRRPVGYVKPEN